MQSNNMNQARDRAVRVLPDGIGDARDAAVRLDDGLLVEAQLRNLARRLVVRDRVRKDSLGQRGIGGAGEVAQQVDKAGMRLSVLG
jgi:hypothetical protein